MTTTSAMKTISKRSVLIPTFKSVAVINPEKLLYIKADQNYCRVMLTDGVVLLSSNPFGKLLDMLIPYGFIQCHKSYAINKIYASKYHKSRKIELINDITIPVARRRRHKFLEMLAGE